MFEILGKGFIAVASALQRDEGNLVRMFATEYNREYRNLVKDGAIISDDFVKRFLDNADYQVDKHARHS